jgi:hypothetical protein
MNVRAVAVRGAVEVAIEDRSRNGVKVDGAKIGSGWVGVNVGSTIKIGRTQLRIDISAQPAGKNGAGASKAAAAGGKKKGSPVKDDKEVVVPLKRARK